MPHFRHHNGHPPDAPIFAQNLDNPQMRLSRKKGVIFGDAWIAQDFPKIPDKSRAIYRRLGRPYLEY